MSGSKALRLNGPVCPPAHGLAQHGLTDPLHGFMGPLALTPRRTTADRVTVRRVPDKAITKKKKKNKKKKSQGVRKTLGLQLGR